MITFLQSIILGLIQGIAEWLPVSSSGHLVLAQEYFGLSVPVLFDVFLHIGTLLAVFVVFWKDIVRIAKSIIDTIILKKSINDIKRDKELLIAWFVFLACIPTAIIGYYFAGWISTLFYSTFAVGIALMLNGFWLFLAEDNKPKVKKLSWPVALFVGFMQGVAIVPGISRSGSTISAALICGVKRETATRFSFLMAIPAIIGAFLFELHGNLTFTSNMYFPAIIASLIAFVVGVFFLKWLLKLVSQKKLHVFAYYCWALGFLVILLNVL